MKKIIACPQLAISTPFFNFNDAIRNQMSAAQSRQAVPLENNEPPIVETTLERSNILQPDIIKAECDCEVIFSSSQLIVTKNENSDKKYSSYKISYLYKIPEEGSKFKKDEIISYKLGYFDEHGNLAQGKNLLCSIILHPWCYEDAIVLNKNVELTSYKYKVIEKTISTSHMLLSLDQKDAYKIIPRVGEKLKAFDPILLIKKSDPNYIIEDPEVIYIPEDSEVIETDIVANRWNKSIREYDIAILEYLQRKDKLAKKIDSLIDDDTIKSEIKRYHNLYNYASLLKSKKKKIKLSKGDFDLYVRVVLRIKEPINVGDKITNRHAAKGVISKITGTDLPVIVNDNRMVDINVDLMSIISRMNIGQLYEIIAGNCIYYLEKRIKEFPNSIEIDKVKEYILKFYEIIDNTEERWVTEQARKFLSNIKSVAELKNVKLTFPAPPFETITREQLINATQYLNPNIKDNFKMYFNQDKSKTKKLPDLSPLLEVVEYNGKQFYATCGYIYFYKLKHMAKEKISGRGSGKMMKKTLQPTGGKKNQGGQRVGEMEIWALLAYDALFNLDEIIRLKSDDIQQKLEYMIKKLYSHDIKHTSKEELEIVKLFKAYLKILHTDIKY